HRPPVARRAPDEVVATVRGIPTRERGAHGPVVDVVLAAAVAPIVRTTVDFGSTEVPALGFWSMTLPALPGVDACSIVCTTNPCDSRSAVAAAYVFPTSCGT